MAKKYEEAGVSIKNGDETVNKIKEYAKSTFSKSVLNDIGLFGAFFQPDLSKYKEPVLVSSVDGVGTKLKIAIELNKHDTIGQDLVNHCVNDIAVCGAEPLFFLDYMAFGKLDSTTAAEIVKGFSIACKENGCALIGGETAEMPGIYKTGDYDLSDGKDDAEAGRLAKEAFLDYQINAPWVQLLRQTVLPFISFPYRAMPMLANRFAEKPWKAAKYAIVGNLLNYLGYAMVGGDDDEDRERSLLPDEKSGSVLGELFPKLIRMGWNGERIVFGYARAGSGQPPEGWLDRTRSYELRRTEEPIHIFEIGVDGRNLRQLTDGERSDLDPAYLPNGDIAFVSERCGTSLQCNEYDKETSYNLYVMNRDGGNIRRLSVNKDGDYLPDHREAVLVILTGGTEEIRHITSSDEKHIHYSGRLHSRTPEGLKEVTAEDQKDRRFGNQLNKYYDEVIAAVRDADTIQIFGPGEAKGELEKRIARAGLKAHILVVETTDKMTDRQIAAKVRERFD